MIERRIKGLLVGCAYGDAMGMPSENLSRNTLSKAFPNGISRFERSSPYDFIGRKFQKGEVTDDTINTLIVCDTIIEDKGQFKTDTYLKRLKSWLKDNEEKSAYIMGPSTKRAIENIDKGVPIDKTGINGTTNGSAMKVSPIGIISNYQDPQEVLDNVKALCLPTHNTNIAITGALVIAMIVSYTLRGNSDIKEIWDLAYKAIDIAKDSGNDLPGPSLKRRLEIVHDLTFSADKKEVISYLEDVLGCGMETVETIPAVMALITLSDLEPKACAIMAANISGDSDTIGAIATGICGSVNFNFTDEDISVLESVNGIDLSKYAKELSDIMIDREMRSNT